MSEPTKARPITVWEFYSAPEELKALSNNGGDEDWIAEVPPDYPYGVNWIENNNSFGCCSVDEYPHPSKPDWKIFIGCHA